jgi:hypothetical protein
MQIQTNPGNSFYKQEELRATHHIKKRLVDDEDPWMTQTT